MQETGNPSLCAFCAHRLGQARQPSHVQRRFLQSSRPVSKPPAEATALREDNVNRGPQPTWGRPAGGLGPAVSWGRSSVGAGPSWSNAGGSSIPEVAAPNSKSSAQSSPGEKIPVQGTAQTDSPHTHNLDPHEKKAREMMLARQAQAQARKVTQGRGNGPESSRAGRLVPRTESERIQAAQREVAKRKALETHEANRAHLKGVRNGSTGPRIRHLLGDSDWKNLPSADDQSNWGQLRSQRDSAAKARAAEEDRRRPRRNNFAEERAQREEQARHGRYTPLSPRSEGRREPSPESEACRSD